jgi:hypothetical protein
MLLLETKYCPDYSTMVLHITCVKNATGLLNAFKDTKLKQLTLPLPQSNKVPF